MPTDTEDLRIPDPRIEPPPSARIGDEFADFTIIAENAGIKVHKEVMRQKPSYIQKTLANSGSNVYTSDFIRYGPTLVVVKFLYDGDIDIESIVAIQDLCDILTAAIWFEVPALAEIVMRKIKLRSMGCDQTMTESIVYAFIILNGIFTNTDDLKLFLDVFTKVKFPDAVVRKYATKVMSKSFATEAMIALLKGTAE